MNNLPETGFLRLPQIIGQEEISEHQAKLNRQHNEKAKAQAIAEGNLDKNGNPKFQRRPTTPQAAVTGLVPVSKSCWWQGIKDGRFPKPVKIGNGRGTFWKSSDIRALIENA